MPSVKFILITFFLASTAFSNESAPPAAEHGAPAAGEHGGGAAPEAPYSGKQTQQWSEVQTKLAAAKTKLEAQEALVKSMMHGSSGGHGGSHLEELKKEDEKLSKLVSEYNRLNTEYETKFPEKGIKENRIYKRLDPQNAVSAESGPTAYEFKSLKLQNKIMKQYPRTAEKLKKNKSKAVKKESSNHEADSHLPNKSGDGVTDQIILQK